MGVTSPGNVPETEDMSLFPLTEPWICIIVEYFLSANYLLPVFTDKVTLGSVEILPLYSHCLLNLPILNL